MDQNTKKQRVAEAVLDYIDNGESLGIGSGSTVNILIGNLSKVKSKIRNIVSSSVKSTELLEANGFEVSELRDVGRLTKYIDGADEVDPKFQLIKGGGACHVQEKLVAALAKKFIVVVDSTKLVKKLNLDFKLPVEVLPSAWKQVQKTLINLGGEGNLRMAQKKAGPIVTDQGNLILDLTFRNGIDQPELLESQINNIPGVLENGLFVNLTDEVLVGKVESDVVGVESLKKI